MIRCSSIILTQRRRRFSIRLLNPKTDERRRVDTHHMFSVLRKETERQRERERVNCSFSFFSFFFFFFLSLFAVKFRQRKALIRESASHSKTQRNLLRLFLSSFFLSFVLFFRSFVLSFVLSVTFDSLSFFLFLSAECYIERPSFLSLLR